MCKILVIDDSRIITDMLRNYLTNEGFEVITAEDGSEGIKAIDEYHPDLVITDIIMPKKNGIEVVMHLKFNRPSIRVIAMSSGGTISAKEHLSNVMRLGADFILKKPFSYEEIHLAITNVMKMVMA